MAAPAPGRLELVRQFVNTRDIEAGKDDVDSPQALTAWLRAADLIEGTHSATPADHRAAIALREALRVALAANHLDDVIPDDALAVLNATARKANLKVSVDASHRFGVQPASGGVAGALGALLVIM